MNDEEVNEMLDVVEKAYKKNKLSYLEYLSLRNEIVRTKVDVSRLREKIAKLKNEVGKK